MEQTSFTERLMEFGLTRQEASIYQCLLTEGKVTGYEVAKQTGISRSNAYNSLASMTEKGAAYLVEEASTRKYVPVPLNEFCKNRVRKLEESARWLQEHMPSEKAYAEGYITIEGAENILNKIKKSVIAGRSESLYQLYKKLSVTSDPGTGCTDGSEKKGCDHYGSAGNFPQCKSISRREQRNAGRSHC